jgi:hypothetical protein
MSYYIPSTECRRLHRFDKTMRFGLSLSRKGALVFVAKFMPTWEVGATGEEQKFYQHVSNVFGLQGLYGLDGRLNSGKRLPGVPVIWRWLDDDGGPFTLRGALSGDFVDYITYNSKPQYVLENERYESALAQGAELQSAIDDGAAAHGDMWKYAARTDLQMTRKVTTREDFRAGLKDPRNAGLVRYLDGDKQKYKNYFVDRYGLQRPPQ